MYFCREIVKVGDWDYLKGLNWSPSVTEKEDTQGIYEFLKICIKKYSFKKTFSRYSDVACGDQN